MKKICIFIITIAMICITAICAACSVNESAKMVTFDMWRFTSGVPNNCITVHSDNENTTFICTVDEGKFWSYSEQEYTKQVALKSEETTWWHENGESPIVRDYIKIIAKDSEKIVGYSVVEVNKTDTWYSVIVLESVWFESSDTVTDEQVNNLIEEAIKK